MHEDDTEIRDAQTWKSRVGSTSRLAMALPAGYVAAIMAFAAFDLVARGRGGSEGGVFPFLLAVLLSAGLGGLATARLWNFRFSVAVVLVLGILLCSAFIATNLEVESPPVLAPTLTTEAQGEIGSDSPASSVEVPSQPAESVDDQLSIGRFAAKSLPDVVLGSVATFAGVLLGAFASRTLVKVGRSS